MMRINVTTNSKNSLSQSINQPKIGHETLLCCRAVVGQEGTSTKKDPFFAFSSNSSDSVRFDLQQKQRKKWIGPCRAVCQKWRLFGELWLAHLGSLISAVMLTDIVAIRPSIRSSCKAVSVRLDGSSSTLRNTTESNQSDSELQLRG